ncbi:MAG: hypothetical protein HUJ64_05435, partial [Limosilactobacillus mucosae]|nr:hypothetical protein [Limosilactobacillus mucosae]
AHLEMEMRGGYPSGAAQIADRVLFLEDGHILEDTPGQQFFKQPQTERAQQFLESMDF